MLRLLTALLAALWASAAVAGPCEDLQRAVAAAPAGSAFVVGPEHRGCDLTVSKRAGLSFTAAPDGALRSVNVSASQDVRFTGVPFDYWPTATTTTAMAAVRIAASQHVSITGAPITGHPAISGVTPGPAVTGAGLTLIGWPVVRGVQVLSSSDVVLEDLDVTGVFAGITLSKVDQARVRRNRLHGLRTTPVNGAELTNVTVADNHMWDLTPYRTADGLAGDHWDFAHFWITAGFPPSADIVIRHNLMDNAGAPGSLGINLEDNAGVGFDRVTIADNTILNAAAQGMRLEDINSGAVTGNWLLRTGGADFRAAPGIYPTRGGKLDVNPALSITGNLSADLFKTYAAYPGNTAIPADFGVAPAWLLDLARKR